MLPFQFTAVHDDFYTYHLSMPGARWLEHCLEDHVDLTEIQTSFRAEDFLARHLAYQNDFLADNVWLYAYLLQQLWGEQEMLCLDVGETGGLFESFPLAYPAAWEYVINYEEIDEGQDNWSFSDTGWCPAKTEICVEYEGRQLDWDTRQNSPVFHFNYRTELIQSLNMLDPGLFAARNYIICSEDQLHPWQVALQGDEAPDLARLLQGDSILVVMNFGEPEEEGFGDYVLIKTARERHEEMAALSQRIESAGARYEQALLDLASDFNFENYLMLLHRCFDLPIWKPSLVL